LTVNNSDTVEGFTFSGGSVDLGQSNGATIANNVFNGGDTSIKFDGASGAHITNNDFNNVAGAVVNGWGLDQSTISGNHFVDSRQPINLDFNNDPSHGRDITIDHNTFTGTTRMPIEVGPTGAYTSNLVVSNNWSDNMNNAGPDPNGMSTAVAYSIISTNGVNTSITGNYAQGPGGNSIGIEMDGSGTITGNNIEGFDYGAIVYGSGFNVSGNHFLDTPIDTVLNYSGRDGVIQNNTSDAASFTTPPEPATSTNADGSGMVAPADPLAADPSGQTSQQSAGGQSVDSSGHDTPTDGTSAQHDVPATQVSDPSTGAQSADASANATPTDGTSAQHDVPATQASDPSAGASDPATGAQSAPTDGTSAQHDVPATQASDPSAGGQSADASGNGAPADGSTAQQDVHAAQPADGQATVSVHGATEPDSALTAPDAVSLEASYQSAIDQHQSTSINFDIGSSAALDQNSISLRDHALVGLEAANPDLKVAFTVTAQSTGLDANALSVLQSAKNDGVHIDAVKILVENAGQSADGNSHTGLTSAATAAEKQLADLGLDAKVGAAWATDSNGAGAHADAHADAHVASSDGSFIAAQPFEFSGVHHQADHIG
jgi:chitinase